MLYTVYGYAAPSGSTLVPVRGIAEWCGARVSYDRKTKTITCEGAGTRVQLALGAKTARVTGPDAVRTVSLSQPATEIDGVTLVPLRFIGEAFGCDVRFIPSGQPWREGTDISCPLPVVMLRFGERTACIPVYALSPADVISMTLALSRIGGFDQEINLIDLKRVAAGHALLTAYWWDAGDGGSEGFWGEYDSYLVVRKIKAGQWKVLIDGVTLLDDKRYLDSELKSQGVPTPVRSQLLADFYVRYD